MLKSTFRMIIIFCIITFIPLYLATTAAMADSAKTCTSCGKPIDGKFLKTSTNHYFHKDCFKCSYCEKVINGSFRSEGNTFFHPDCFKKANGLICSYCNKLLDKSWKENNGNKYHPSCYHDHVQLRCDICSKVIEGSFSKDASGKYHAECYRETKLDRCVVCSVPLEGKFVTDVWGNHSHESHDGNPVSMCDSCGRILSEKSSEGAYLYDDGRAVCGICKKSAVISSGQITSSRKKVMAVLSGVGLTGIPVSVPVHLVDVQTLAEKSDRRHNGNAKGFTHTVSRTKNSVKTMTHTIYILNGLPSLEFEGVLAHELLHVWLNENDIKMSSKKTEGFCNLGSMLVNTADQSPYAEILQSQIETNPDRIYGKGYRIMKKQLDSYGWDELIRRIK